MVKTIEWTDAGVVMIDQRILPTEETYITCKDYLEVADAIQTMVIRGAPAIGVAAAMGFAIGVQKASDENLDAQVEEISKVLAATRPTAVNLFWAIERMKRLYALLRTQGVELPALRQRLIDEAKEVLRDDIEINKAMGRHGAALLPQGATVMTHCNAGALATAGYGSALGVIRAAIEQGKKVAVFADETRPFLQGSRLTAWELVREGISTTVITESMAGPLMRAGEIDLVVVGADRIAANGDTANKIGTYTVAVLAREHKVPFFVAAPLSTIDLATPDGDHIPIEERDQREVSHLGSSRLAPEGALFRNPAFDVTPHRYISGIITERGIFRAPYIETLKKAFEERAVQAG